MRIVPTSLWVQNFNTPKRICWFFMLLTHPPTAYFINNKCMNWGNTSNSSYRWAWVVILKKSKYIFFLLGKINLIFIAKNLLFFIKETNQLCTYNIFPLFVVSWRCYKLIMYFLHEITHFKIFRWVVCQKDWSFIFKTFLPSVPFPCPTMTP